MNGSSYAQCATPRYLKTVQFSSVNLDGFAKSRHSGENRSPETLQLIEKTGFRLSPE
jgi:hypothetical protein